MLICISQKGSLTSSQKDAGQEEMKRSFKVVKFWLLLAAQEVEVTFGLFPGPGVVAAVTF